MRSILAAMLFIFLAGFSFALEAQTVDKTAKDDQMRREVVQQKLRIAEQLAKQPRQMLRGQFSGPQTCYTLRTMLAAQKRGSDETKIVGERTCTPASQFDVKTAIQKSK